MERKDYTSEFEQIRQFHREVVEDIKQLMLAYNVVIVDLTGSSCQHVQILGTDWTAIEVSAVFIENDKVFFDCILDIDTEELAEMNENGDISEAYPYYDANDFTKISPFKGIVGVYDAVYEVLEYNLN